MGKIVYRGGTYTVIDPMEWLLAEAAFIKRQTGQTVGDIAVNASRSDAEAIAACLYVAKKRAGEKVRWEDFDDFTVGECDFIPDGESRADYSDADKVTDEGGADPTPPTGTTPDPDSSTTSPRSRSTSGTTRGKSKS